MTVRNSLRRNAELSFQKALTTLLSFRLSTGCSAGELRKFVTSCMESAINDHSKSSPWSGIDVNEMGSILRTWHLDTEFLTTTGKPRPLRTEGKFGLRQLITNHFPSRPFASVIATLKENGLIRRQRNGYWMPNESYARIPKPTAELLAHFGEGIARLAETVTKNISSTNKRSLLFERAAKVESLPAKDASSFREYVEKQAAAFITTVDDWLESRAAEGKRTRAGACTAGVHAFAFIDESLKTRASQVRSRKAKAIRLIY